MKRAALILIAAAGLAALAFNGRWLPHAGLWLGLAPQPARYLGYVEGETILVAPPVSGRLVSRPVVRGAEVAQGAELFRLDTATADAEVARMSAGVAVARAQLENLYTGKRDIEQEVIRAQRRETEAALRLAEKDLDRARDLVAKGNTPQARFDQASAQVDQLQAKVQQLVAQEAAGDLGGRKREIEAAEARVSETQAMLAEAEARRRDLAPAAPLAARVESTFYDVGEWVAAGQPVVSLLAPDRIKLRFFVPQADVARMRPGATVAFTCDGCPAGQRAVITYVSPRAEYTPPVIYSQSARAKLVFLVEARPVSPLETLLSGLPVEVQPTTEDGP